MTPLYSIRTDGDQWRITKFVDGDVESSYLTTHSECDCPAGHRHTCRHRQMLPQMLAHGLCDTHWFFCFDTGGQIVDFNGTSKHLLDQLADISGVQMVSLDDPATLYNTIADAVGEPRISRTQEETAKDTLSPRPVRKTFTVPEGYEAIRDADGRATGEVRPVPAGQHCQGSKSWRRL